ncbi:hypothetical protein M3Y96_01122400 [Aphelenchoides besseyi]|nr:hypothetical protein M3Y96_01122400 [Aphelenchoides besseyi]
MSSSATDNQIERVLRFRICIVAQKPKKEVVRELPVSPIKSSFQSPSNVESEVVSGQSHSPFSDWNASSGRSSLLDDEMDNEQLIRETNQFVKKMKTKYGKQTGNGTRFTESLKPDNNSRTDLTLNKLCTCNCTACGCRSLSHTSATSGSMDNSAATPTSIRDSSGRKVQPLYVDARLPGANLRERDRVQHFESTGSTQSGNEDAFGSPFAVQSTRSSFGRRMSTPLQYKKR